MAVCTGTVCRVWFAVRTTVRVFLTIVEEIFVSIDFYNLTLNKTPAQAFTPPAEEKKMGTIWIFVYYAVYGSGRGRCRDFLVLKWGGGVLICKYGI